MSQISTINITIDPASFEERPILRHLMELYQYDFSELDGSDLSPAGLYDYPYLDHYWVEEDRSPFIVRVGGHLAGFVLVTRYNYLTGLKDGQVVAEFFIVRKYRHQGVGEYAAGYIFDKFPGSWQVAQIPENTAAIAFWHKVIGRYTSENYQEYILKNERWHGPVQAFTSPHTPSRQSPVE